MLMASEGRYATEFVRVAAAGLSDPAEARAWRRRIRARIRQLQEDRMDFGLDRVGQRELNQLELLLHDRIDDVDIWAAIMILGLVVLVLWLAGLSK